MVTATPSVLDAKLAAKSPAARIGVWVFAVALVVGVAYAGSRLLADLSSVHTTSAWSGTSAPGSSACPHRAPTP